MKRIQIGDVFEITTPKGIAHLQYVHQNKTIGELIRILPGLYDSTPEEMNNLVGQKELFYVHFPLKAAYMQSIVSCLGKYEIPDNLSIPTHFRTEHVVKGEFVCWHIVDYVTWQRTSVQKLSDTQIKLSPWGTWNDTLLIEKLSEEWTLEKWI